MVVVRGGPGSGKMNMLDSGNIRSGRGGGCLVKISLLFAVFNDLVYVMF